MLRRDNCFEITHAGHVLEGLLEDFDADSIGHWCTAGTPGTLVVDFDIFRLSIFTVPYVCVRIMVCTESASPPTSADQRSQEITDSPDIGCAK